MIQQPYSARPTAMENGPQMSIARIFGQACLLYWHNARLFVAIGFSMWLPLLLLTRFGFVANVLAMLNKTGVFSTNLTPTQAANLPDSVVYGIAALILGVIVASVVVNSALVIAIMARITGQPASVEHVYRALVPRGGVVLLAVLWAVARLLSILALGSIVVGIVGAMLGRTLAGAFLADVCVLGVIGLMARAAVSWVLLPQVILIGQARFSTASRMSVALITGHWWRTFGLLLLVGVLTMIIVLGTQAALGAFVPANAPSIVQFLTDLATVATTVLVAPLQATALTLLYLGLSRKPAAV